MKIELKKDSELVDVEEILRKKVKKFGKAGAHITMPKRHVDKNATVLVEEPTGSWASGTKKAMKRKGIR